MDKYPVFREEQTVGELTVAPDALYTAFSVSCRGQEGLWCAWAAYLAVYIFCYYGTRISWNLFFFK